MKLAVVLPSRGLVYSKTVEELYSELGSIKAPFHVFWSHGLPIPDCFEKPTQTILEGDYDYIWYVEEDMVLPKGILRELLNANVDVAACDYPVGGGKGGTVLYDPDGTPFFTGTGCMLVKTSILRRMKPPIWRDDIRWEPYVEDGFIHFRIHQREEDIYGQQDIAFGLRLYANGHPVKVIKHTIGQREVLKRGGRGSNNGYHEIIDRTEIVPRDELKYIPKHQTFEEIIIDGKLVKVPLKKYEALKSTMELELPNYIKYARGVFDCDDDVKDWLVMEKV